MANLQGKSRTFLNFALPDRISGGIPLSPLVLAGAGLTGIVPSETQARRILPEQRTAPLFSGGKQGQRFTAGAMRASASGGKTTSPPREKLGGSAMRDAVLMREKLRFWDNARSNHQTEAEFSSVFAELERRLAIELNAG